ncbi:Protein of unknown function [Gryllus bimaculatus]|nr:Protein of unknown function [Gryllus bimaculatus]
MFYASSEQLLSLPVPGPGPPLRFPECWTSREHTLPSPALDFLSPPPPPQLHPNPIFPAASTMSFGAPCPHGLVRFRGEIVLTYMEFQLDSGEYCQAQHK